ncbi:MAG TPA: hypothetical protein VF928_10610 [Usitatibacteraceae bacterium]
MGLGLSLLAIFLLFCLLMAAVLAFCLRERHRIDATGTGAIDPSPEQADPAGHPSPPSPPSSLMSLHSPPRKQADEDADQRVALAVFGAIFLGALLAVVTGYLVFFRDWAD